MEKPKHPLHLKYPDLQKSPEVAGAVAKKERLEDTSTPNDPRQRIEAYMDRLERVFLNKDERVRERNIEMLHENIYDTFIIKRENVPESYFDLQQRVARERGQPVEEIPLEMRERMIDTIVEDQKASLDQWIHYLSSDDAMYPPWFKYLVFRNVVHLSQFDKTLGKFKTRTESTVAPFPDVYQEPLAKICDLYESAEKDTAALKDPVRRAFFEKKFPALYAHYIQESLAAKMERGEETRGEWVKYEHGDMDGAEELFNSLQGKGTGWCTAGHSTAETQIESGDFYVYYTYDKDGKTSQPRVAIRMEENRIAEVRGILEHQQMEPHMQQVLDDKLAEFGPEADTFRKKSADMKLLTALERKTEKKEPLTKDELIFLYEIDARIEGFGYQKDPRIKELRASRNPEKDMLVVLDCAPEQIAHTTTEINENTKAYVGALEPGIFSKLTNVEHVYTSFPEGKIRFDSVEIGGTSAAKLEKTLEKEGVQLSTNGRFMLRSKDFTTLKNPEEAALVRLRVEDLGFPRGATTDEIYTRAEELGLELCPAEVGPQYRLKYTDQPSGEWLYIGMKQIPVSDGSPHVFRVEHDSDGRWLGGHWAEPAGRCYPGIVFVFRLRKVSSAL